ncbi:uncharacterized protein BP01DRAFT_370329 [Aspergillus saccharolyticus JOP 1030-1]|uniref:Transketolase-like pyrimidine-binding domain-containing protein n=1 Tax=Aspergillus saccharolyticus JOP 1030-1 TaxID=1450539 RepID=A0A318ZZF6_9EURO|nr:hypothetical protein BP01DRAFT_370329 [Aspergillus saccharolyticus JOP 1030-1]PYH49663.1 hypothetical protein BP01DRAFT_370329 [Aspergillus saccharolyticus JOP 1030-1]
MAVSLDNSLVNGASTSPLVHQLFKDHDQVLKTFRLLIADLCQQFGGGHPGGAIGMAATGVALWRYVMQYAPHTPDYFNRDRFVLSNAKSYHSDRVDALCPGHPEIEHEGIEVTTGPLGQGITNAVGLAMATKNLAAKFNRLGYDIVSNHTWCMIGDACLQEGVGLEAISFAGHLKLNNLTVIYDNNQITRGGSVDLTNTEDVDTKMHACGWDVIDVEDGCYDIEGLPTFINVRTVIGLGSQVAGMAAAHGAAFESPDVADMKRNYDFDPDETLVIGEEVRKFFQDLPSRGETLVNNWNALVKRYSEEFPDLGAEFQRRMRGELPLNWKDLIPSTFPERPTASRASSGLVFNPIAKEFENFMVGNVDLSPSVNMIWPGEVDFQHPALITRCGINGNYFGRYIQYDVREHAMCTISHGMAAFASDTFIPVTSSFLMFYLYAAPSVRMGALQHLQVIHAATHDSIGMEEDGPTHQPIELAALYRAMPNLLYIRPAENAAVTIIGVGAELSFALEVAQHMKEAQGVVARVISFPCQRLFEQQPVENRREVLRRHQDIPAVVIEPYAPNGWERYADAGISVRRFGHSLPGKAAYKFFGYETGVLSAKVSDYLARLKKGEALRGEFIDL